MDRRSFHRLAFGSAAAAAAVPAAALLTEPAYGTGRLPGRPGRPAASLVEYALPQDEQTHEMVKMPGRPIVCVSQMGASRLVKLHLGRDEHVDGVAGFPLGPSDGRMHGLALSARHPGRIWVTHEGGSRLYLVDPRADALRAAPRIERTLEVPGGGKGPHYVHEYGDWLWVTLKETEQVLALNHTDPSRWRLYEAMPKPIFALKHPVSGDVFVSQDAASRILRIDPRSGRTKQLPVPWQRGGTPVGIAAGAGALWVVLLGSPDHGTGTFGRIGPDGHVTWFPLTSEAARSAALLHVAFDPPYSGRGPGMWLLGSSIVSPNVRDLIIRVRFDAGYTRILGEETYALPTQLCKAHRLLPLGRTVLATELAASQVAQLGGAAAMR